MAEENLYDPLETLDGLFQIAKGPEFYKSFTAYVMDKSNEPFWKFFNTKQHRISDSVISYRLINHWEKEGLIDNVREEEGGWRKYSLMDIVWLSIINQLRYFGMGLKEIKDVRKSLVSKYENCEYGELEFFTGLGYLNRTPVFVLVFSTFRAEVGTAYQIIDSEERYGMLNHISINLNAILQGLFRKKECKPIYRNFVEITKEQEEIMETIKMEKVEEIILAVKNGKAVKMDFTITEPPDSNVGQLKNKNAFQEIHLMQHKGNTVSVKRTVSKKLNNEG